MDPGSVCTEIWVVSRVSDVERRRLFGERANELRHPWRFFDAQESLHPGLAYDPVDSRRTIGRELRPAELGCYSSHFALWLQLVDSEADQYLILEDDVLMDCPFVDHLCSQNFSKLGIPYLRLFSKVPCPFRVVATPFIDRYRHLIQYLDLALGTQAYFVSKGAAADFVRHSATVRRTIDRQMDRTWDHGVPNLALVPFSVVETSAPSTIGDGRFEAKSLSSADWRSWMLTMAFEKLRRIIHRMSGRLTGWALAAPKYNAARP